MLQWNDVISVMAHRHRAVEHCPAAPLHSQAVISVIMADYSSDSQPVVENDRSPHTRHRPFVITHKRTHTVDVYKQIQKNNHHHQGFTQSLQNNLYLRNHRPSDSLPFEIHSMCSHMASQVRTCEDVMQSTGVRSDRQS